MQPTVKHITVASVALDHLLQALRGKSEKRSWSSTPGKPGQKSPESQNHAAFEQLIDVHDRA